MAKKKESSVEVTGTTANTSLAELKSLARNISAYMNAQYKEAVSYVPDESTKELIQISRWLEMPVAFREAVELPGFPFGNITCVFGKPDTGKTTLLMEGIVACQKQGVLPILILTEHKFDFTRLASMGADPEALVVLHATNLEQGYSFIEKVLRDAKNGSLVVETDDKDIVIDISNFGCFIFWDSIGNTMAESELASEVEDHAKSMGKGAKAIKTLTRRVNQLLSSVRASVGVLFLNQSYQSMPSYGPSIETPYGGDGIPYSSALVIRTRRIRDLDMKQNGKDMVIGLETKLEVKKNHISAKKTISTVYTTAYGIVPATKEALEEYKTRLKANDK